MDTPVAISALLVYIIVCVILSQILKTKHSFWWMLFLSPPVGAIISLLLDIREKVTDINRTLRS